VNERRTLVEDLRVRRCEAIRAGHGEEAAAKTGVTVVTKFLRVE
jgi:hypothetical protein